MDLKTWCDKNTQTKLAGLCGVTQGRVSQWIKEGVPLERALQIERVTNCEVTRHDLRPDAFPEESGGTGRVPA